MHRHIYMCEYLCACLCVHVCTCVCVWESLSMYL
uniref:Uncharacterized protein n=1 Tax=Anguilla anguilla TaxID=7936 RepID=A0A0E9SHE2_ANGAN